VGLDRRGGGATGFGARSHRDDSNTLEDYLLPVYEPSPGRVVAFPSPLSAADTLQALLDGLRKFDDSGVTHSSNKVAASIPSSDGNVSLRFRLFQEEASVLCALIARMKPWRYHRLLFCSYVE
jgi:hypothetical protein